MDKPVVSQPYYNALNRMPEVEVLPVCAHHGLGVVPYSPIARGVLTGKYKSGRKPLRGSRAARNDKRIMQTEYRQESFTISETVVEHANARGMDPVHFAMHWVLANPVVTSVIAGPRTVAQMKIVNIDVIRPEPTQRLLELMRNPASAKTTLVWVNTPTERPTNFCCQYPFIALFSD